MSKLMSLSARRELLASVRRNYCKANWVEKGKILDGFVAATDYERKYASRLLNSDEVVRERKPQPSAQLYDEQVGSAGTSGRDLALSQKRLWAIYSDPNSYQYMDNL